MFCSRASLIKAQAKLADNTDPDAQLVVRFSDGTQKALNIKRADIENMLYTYQQCVETEIQNALDAANAATPEADPTQDGEEGE